LLFSPLLQKSRTIDFCSPPSTAVGLKNNNLGYDTRYGIWIQSTGKDMNTKLKYGIQDPD